MSLKGLSSCTRAGLLHKVRRPKYPAIPRSSAPISARIMSMLRVHNLNAFYDRTQVLHDIDLRVDEGEIVGLVGANAAGKTATLLSILGIKTRTVGEIWLADERIDHLPAYERVRRAIVLIPERRRLFPFMTVLENLELGAFLPKPREHRQRTLQTVFDLLPILAERRNQMAGSL